MTDTDPIPLRIWTGRGEGANPIDCGSPNGLHDMQVIGWGYAYDRDYDAVTVSQKLATTLQCRRCLVRTDLDGRIL